MHTSSTLRTATTLAFICLVAIIATVGRAAPTDAASSQAEALRHVRNAETAYSAGDFDTATDEYAAAIKSKARAPRTFYNAACSAALAGKTRLAFEWLNTAITKGWRDIDHLKRDTDLTTLHNDPRWKQVIQNAEQQVQEILATLTHLKLREELLEMKRVDQEVRSLAHGVVVAKEPHGTPHEDHTPNQHKDKKDAAHDHAHDHKNHNHQEHNQHAHARQVKQLPVHGMEQLHADTRHAARLKEILKEHGWPTKSMVGEEGALAAFLLAQHADADPKFQRDCLQRMQAAPEGEVSKNNIAYLTDRVLVNEGKKQLYGTQFHIVDGKLAPRPIQDERNLDRRRAEAGMITMDAYRKHMSAHNSNDEH